MKFGAFGKGMSTPRRVKPGREAYFFCYDKSDPDVICVPDNQLSITPEAASKLDALSSSCNRARSQATLIRACLVAKGSAVAAGRD